jgi:hypothetical protein
MYPSGICREGGRSLARRAPAALPLALVLLLAASGPARAGFLFNTDFQNTTGMAANDLHLMLTANQNINITQTYSATVPTQISTAFPNATVTGNNSKAVTIDWTGATVSNGNWTHVGAQTNSAVTGLTVNQA